MARRKAGVRSLRLAKTKLREEEVKDGEGRRRSPAEYGREFEEEEINKKKEEKILKNNKKTNEKRITNGPMTKNKIRRKKFMNHMNYEAAPMNKDVKKIAKLYSDKWVRRLIINFADWSEIELSEGVKSFNTGCIYLIESRSQRVVYYYGKVKWTRLNENGTVNGEQDQNMSHEEGISIERWFNLRAKEVRTRSTNCVAYSKQLEIETESNRHLDLGARNLLGLAGPNKTHDPG